MQLSNESLLEILKAIIGGQSSTGQAGGNIYQSWVGKYVICRSRNEGVNAGVVKQVDETGVVLEEARRLYYHKPVNKNVSWYEGVAKTGISSDSKVGTAVTKVIAEDYSLTECSQEAQSSIRQAKDNEQS